MMFRIVVFLFIFSNVFSQNILIEGTKREEIFFKDYLVNELGIPYEKIDLNSFNENEKKDDKKEIKTIKILPEDTALNDNTYIEVEINGKRTVISEIIPREIKVKGGNVLVKLISQENEFPYIWEDEYKNLYINNLEFLKDEKFKKDISVFFIEYLDKEVGLKKDIAEKKEDGDISIIANNIIKILGSGVILLFILLIFSKKKRFGDSFRGD